jgi:small-conductance mechanosensitive channel
MESLKTLVLGNPAWAWMLAGLVSAVSVSAAALLKKLPGLRLAQPAGGVSLNRRAIASVSARSSLILVFGISLWAAALILTLPDKWESMIRSTAILALAMQVALWLNALISLATEESETRVARRDPGSVTTVRSLGLLCKAVLWTFLVLLALHNAGVDITALVAGLGIGGVAIALAVQSILADIFASVSIMLDKPYQVGDFIVVGDSMGTVERIGLKTTRVRSLSGEQLVFSNSELLKSRIRNFKRMSERRVEFAIGVAYSTPVAKVEQVPALLREAISSNDQVRLERANFKEFGESSLTFECVYFVKEFSYSVYIGIQESINLAILRRFQEEEIEFGHPTRTLYIAQGVAPVRW